MSDSQSIAPLLPTEIPKSLLDNPLTICRIEGRNIGLETSARICDTVLEKLCKTKGERRLVMLIKMNIMKNRILNKEK